MLHFLDPAPRSLPPSSAPWVSSLWITWHPLPRHHEILQTTDVAQTKEAEKRKRKSIHMVQMTIMWAPCIPSLFVCFCFFTVFSAPHIYTLLHKNQSLVCTDVGGMWINTELKRKGESLLPRILRPLQLFMIVWFAMSVCLFVFSSPWRAQDIVHSLVCHCVTNPSFGLHDANELLHFQRHQLLPFHAECKWETNRGQRNLIWHRLGTVRHL